MTYLENFPVGRPTEIIIVNNAPTHLRRSNTREKVVEWIEQWCTRNIGHVAFCFGFYMAMVDKGDHFEGAYLLKNSNSLRALKNTNFSNYFDKRKNDLY
ncbi:hypothetical protein V5N11_026452 [Cardamine amara subsp. amara]|uniref:Uncharacterized protein n=1 Tax=Cardamine amara subsp. amara TaxID=228776 RepID=A0ABD1B2J5_CARAN